MNWFFIFVVNSSVLLCLLMKIFLLCGCNFVGDLVLFDLMCPCFVAGVQLFKCVQQRKQTHMFAATFIYSYL